MSNNADAELYLELVQLFEQVQQLQTASTQVLDRARQTLAAIARADAVALAPPPDVPLSPEQTLDEIITLLGHFSLATQIAMTKALGLGLAATARTQLNVKHPLVA